MDAVMHHSGRIEVPRGLAGVVVAETGLSDVHGDEGWFQYRDRSAVGLAASASFEDVWHLLLIGDLPDPAQRRVFAERIARARDGADVRETVAALRGVTADPVAVLKAAWPVLSARRGMSALYDLDEAGRTASALELAAVTPTIVALAHRAGSAPVTTGRGVVADHLANLTGREPDAWAERALSAYLIAAMDHGFNASTFAARVIASTGADLASCLAGALGALSGPLHGGAPARALEAIDRFDDVDDIEPWVRAELASGRRLMGFGHAVYRTADPRARLLRDLAVQRGGHRVEIAVAYERIAEQVLAEVKPGRGLHANVELFAAVVMELCGVPRELMTPTFAVARTIGWTAHAVEQARDPKIIRPAARFTGPAVRAR
nr:citrate/2-methylcitrate synthase [Microbacterium bovistercoris]